MEKSRHKTKNDLLKDVIEDNTAIASCFNDTNKDAAFNIARSVENITDSIATINQKIDDNTDATKVIETQLMNSGADLEQAEERNNEQTERIEDIQSTIDLDTLSYLSARFGAPASVVGTFDKPIITLDSTGFVSSVRNHVEPYYRSVTVRTEPQTQGAEQTSAYLYSKEHISFHGRLLRCRGTAFFNWDIFEIDVTDLSSYLRVLESFKSHISPTGVSLQVKLPFAIQPSSDNLMSAPEEFVSDIAFVGLNQIDQLDAAFSSIGTAKATAKAFDFVGFIDNVLEDLVPLPLGEVLNTLSGALDIIGDVIENIARQAQVVIDAIPDVRVPTAQIQTLLVRNIGTLLGPLNDFFRLFIDGCEEIQNAINTILSGINFCPYFEPLNVSNASGRVGDIIREFTNIINRLQSYFNTIKANFVQLTRLAAGPSATGIFPINLDVREVLKTTATVIQNKYLGSYANIDHISVHGSNTYGIIDLTDYIIANALALAEYETSEEPDPPEISLPLFQVEYSYSYFVDQNELDNFTPEYSVNIVL